MILLVIEKQLLNKLPVHCPIDFKWKSLDDVIIVGLNLS